MEIQVDDEERAEIEEQTNLIDLKTNQPDI